ncbi:MAG: hypothetical protein NC218_03185 [Acetobacter sp.]|nr:hypothetical protein [Acetobacter sp.]
MKYQKVSSDKYSTLISIINDSKNNRFFSELDALLIKKRFENVYELSLTENILRTSSHNLTSSNIKKILNIFFKTTLTSDINEKRYLYEIVKLSNLPAEKLNRAINAEMLSTLISSLSTVSRETFFISFDFLILRILDNFILKYNNKLMLKDFINVKNNVLKKLTRDNYQIERNEKETTFLCWIDRILSATINEEITPNDFISINKKIFGLTHNTIYGYWKVLHSTNYLLLQHEFSANESLRAFKRELMRNIENQYTSFASNIIEIKELTIAILAKRTPNKEDFYYLFDTLKITAKQNEENMLYCIKLCQYIIEQNSYQNIFCYRFIRKYFIEMFYDILDNSFNNIEIMNEEIATLMSLFHIDSYFCFDRNAIFKNIIDVMKKMNNGQNKLNYSNFYKFCDAIDYIVSENIDVLTCNIIDYISYQDLNKSKIIQHFDLLLSQIKASSKAE